MTIWEAQKLDPRLNRGRKTTFTEAVGAAFKRDAPEAGFTPDRDLLDEAYKPLMDFTGGRYGEATPLYLEKGASVEILRKMGSQSFHPDTETLEAFIADLDAKGIEYPADITPSNLAKRRNRLEVARASNVRSADEVLSRASTGSQIFGGFLGSAGAQFTDPVNLLTLPIGASARAGLLATVAIESSLNAGIELAQTPGRNAYRRAIGLEETSALENAAAGALFGGGISGVMKVAPKAIKAGSKATGAGVRALSSFVSQRLDRAKLAKAATESEDPEVRALAEAVLRDLEDEAAAVADPSPEAIREHTARSQAAADAAVNGSPLEIPDRPAVAVPRASILNGEIEEVDPRTLLIQPEVFQFKSDTVAAGGLTAKLMNDPPWQNERAGIILVYEYADGSRAVSDGHQRTGLANRIMARDPSQEIRLAAKVYRELDGFTVEDVRVLAALKNIAEAADGMTAKMAVDAAKVLRIRPDAIRDLPSGPGIVRARELSALSDEAFNLVINRVIPADQAALIGRLAKDPAMHGPLAKLLARTEPETAAQAESIISQALEAPVERETMADLFGEQEVAESLYLERAKVLERTMKLMRDDRQLARTLTEKSGRVEGIGKNRLDRESNQALREAMEKALVTVNSLAHRVGPISEALNDAARRYRKDGRLADAAERVRGIVRDEIERNGLAGGGAGNAGRAAKPAGAGQPSSDPNEGFGELTGEAPKAQIKATEIPKPSPEEELKTQVMTAISPNWQDYFVQDPAAVIVPMASLRPMRARPDGILNSVPRMARAAAGEIEKRSPLMLKDEGDGTYSIRDGNSTYAIGMMAGWEGIPGKVVSDADFRTEQARTAVSRVFNDALGSDKKRLVLQSDLPQAEGLALHAALRRRQPFSTVEDAVERQAVNQEALNAEAEKIAAGISGKVKTGKVKAADRIMDKLQRKFGPTPPDGAVRAVGDIARVGFTADTPEAADAFLEALAKRFHVVDEGWIEAAGGYLDRKAAVVFDDNSVGEIQIWPPGMAEAKKAGGHDDYKVWQNPSTSPEVKATMAARMEERYGAVKAALDPAYAAKLGIGAPSSSVKATASASDTSIARSSAKTSEATAGSPPTGSQEPSKSVMPSEPDTAASVPSNMKNRIIETPSLEKTAAGDQMLFDGVNPITDSDRLRQRADKPLKARPRGSDTEIGGLFDPNDPSRFDLFDLVPVGRSVDDAGEEVATTMTREELMADLDADDEAAAVLEICVSGATK